MKRKLLLFKILILFFSTVLSITLIEQGFKLYAQNKKEQLDKKCQGFSIDKFADSRGYTNLHNFYKPYEQIRHCSVEFDYTYHIDKNGFRDYTNGTPTKDILAIGDSLTFGFGVKDNEAFPALLNAYNAGMWGNPFNYQFEAFKRDIELTKPKKVIWGIYPSHIITMMPKEWSDRCPGDWKYELGDSFFSSLKRETLQKVLPLWDKSYVAKYIMKTQNISRINLQDGDIYLHKDCYETKEILLYDVNLDRNHYTFDPEVNKSLYTDREAVYTQMQDYFTEAKKIADQNGTEIYFMFFPSRRQLRLMDGTEGLNKGGGSLLDPSLPSKQLTKIIVESGYPPSHIIDFADYFIKEKKYRQYFFVIDAHWNARGHQFVADIIRQRVNEK